MTTLTIRIPDGNPAIMQALDRLREKGATITEESPYDEAYVEKIRKSEREFKERKGEIIDLDSVFCHK